MGLLDRMDDPQTMGLLQFGLGMLGSKGSFRDALSQAGPQALQAVRQMQQDKQRRAQIEQAQKLQDLQMQQAQMALSQQQAQQNRQQAVEGAYRGALRSPEQMAMAGGGGPSVANASAIRSSMPQVDQSALIRALTQADPMAAYQMLQPKPADYKVVGDALVSVGPAGVKEAYRAPQKPAAPSDIAKLTAEMAALPPGSPLRSVYENAIQKATTHAPAASAVSYGSPVPIMLPDGSIGYAQPGNKAGAAPQVMTGPNGAPLKKPAGAESAPTEDERKAAGWVSQAETAWANMRAAAFDQRGNIKADAKPSPLEVIAPHEIAKNAARSPGRQKFVQASSSLSESLLRAATGAGVNRDEAEQKVRELTPQPMDSQEVIQQKMNAIPPYLESLRMRANRALPKGLAPVAPVPGPGNGGARFLGFEEK